jgi:SAM-dependent methyltransferase
MTQSNEYIGNELELFKNALNWKKYFSNKISKYIQGDILEIGAGIAVNSKYLINKKVKSITSVEPDTALFNSIELNQKEISLETKKIINGTLQDVNQKYDTIIYIDVLEHIEDSSNEIQLASEKLNKNGHLIILVPAYNFLFSEFDKSIGHFRRYDKKMLRQEVNNKLEEKEIYYLDSMGFFASLANKLILKKETPNNSNIVLWDKFLVPISKITDPLFFNTFGKSLIGVYKKSEL